MAFDWGINESQGTVLCSRSMRFEFAASILMVSCNQEQINYMDVFSN